MYVHFRILGLYTESFIRMAVHSLLNYSGITIINEPITYVTMTTTIFQ